MFKVVDKILFDDGFRKSGEVLLVGTDSLLVRVKQGTGHDGFVSWTEALGWQRDETGSCWFVSSMFATVVKSRPTFKGNAK